jgi:hypothetical protein
MKKLADQTEVEFVTGISNARGGGATPELRAIMARNSAAVEELLTTSVPDSPTPAPRPD